jgi:hypothetical protein
MCPEISSLKRKLKWYGTMFCTHTKKSFFNCFNLVDPHILTPLMDAADNWTNHYDARIVNGLCDVCCVNGGTLSSGMKGGWVCRAL